MSSWTPEILVGIIENEYENGSLDLIEMQDILTDLRQNTTFVVEDFIHLLDESIKIEVKKNNMCPYCLNKLNENTEKQLLGYYGSEPAYNDSIVNYNCYCGYKEEL